jgi:hypothetical protein
MTMTQPVPAPYEPLGQWGRGGMSIVCKMRDGETGEALAIEALIPEIAADSGFVGRFKNGLRRAHQIANWNVFRRRLCDDRITAGELDRVKRTGRSISSSGGNSPHSVLTLWQLRCCDGFSEDYWNCCPSKVNAGSALEIDGVARKYSHHRARIAVSSDASKFCGALDTLGPIES